MYDLSKAFLTALDLETTGYEFYTEAANKSTNSLTASILYSLAEDEKDHERLLRNFYNALVESKGWPKIDESKKITEDAHEKITRIIKGSELPQREDSTFIGIYEKARKAEERSSKFYYSEYKIAEDNDVKEFFRYLARIEDIHMKMLDILLESTKSANM